MRALSILQPWAFLIVRPDIADPLERAKLRGFQAIKDVENRSWPTNVRGEVYVHAGKGFDTEGYMNLRNHWFKFGLPGQVGDAIDRLDDGVRGHDLMKFGGIIGTMTIVGCAREIASPWKANDCYGFSISDSKPLPFRPFRGKLGFFEVPDE